MDIWFVTQSWCLGEDYNSLGEGKFELVGKTVLGLFLMSGGVDIDFDLRLVVLIS